MKLLLDENLSPRMAAVLQVAYPGTAHVRDLGLRGEPDARVWEAARSRGFCIVSKDNDFRQLSFLKGAPPKVVWLSVGNAGTAEIEQLLRARAADLEAFTEDPEESLLVLGRP